MIDWTSVDEYACSNLDVTKYGSLVIAPNKLLQLFGLRVMWESIKTHESDWMSDIQEIEGLPTYPIPRVSSVQRPARRVLASSIPPA